MRHSVLSGLQLGHRNSENRWMMKDFTELSVGALEQGRTKVEKVSESGCRWRCVLTVIMVRKVVIPRETRAGMAAASRKKLTQDMVTIRTVGK